MAHRVRWGLSLPNRGIVLGAGDPPELLAMAEIADRSEVFDAVFTGDSLIAKPRIDAIVFLATVAGRTQRVLLGTSCMASFIFRHPIVLANQWAALDQMSGGRAYLVACMGGGPHTKSAHRSPSGARWEIEFAAMGTTVEERAGRLVEGIEILRTLWTGEAVTHRGQFYQFADVVLNVTPLQAPCPIAIASNPQPPYAGEAIVERALKRVARHGDGWQVEMSTPEEFARRWQRIREYAAALGRSPGPVTSMIHFYVNVNRDADAAFDEARRFYEHYHAGRFPDEYLHWRLVTGTAEEVAERINRFIAGGCNLPIIRFATYDPMGQLRLALTDLMPRLRDHADHAPVWRP
jgi:alkanesulfonate monooxygenase SsuD/methylene tetrahydromethanopterin reductase-like flavin-dependent oxidoreductase (luciferase family)